MLGALSLLTGGGNKKIVKTLIARNPVMITGGQGTGKTTLVMSIVLEYLKQQEGARFYHHGLDGAKIGEQFDDPTQWYTLPEGSIIYIDECDKNGFHNETTIKNAENLPQHLREITELRHRGHYLILSTVHVDDIHHFVRKKCMGWADLFRPFGLKYAICSVYPGWKSASRLGKSERKEWENSRLKLYFVHDKKVQKQFKSSSLHTVSYSAKNFPLFKLLGVLGSILLVIILVVVSFRSITSVGNPNTATQEAPKEPPPAAPPSVTATMPTPQTPSRHSTDLSTRQRVSLVYELSPQERMIYSVPDFMDNAHYQLYTHVEGYTCGRAVMGGQEWCRCYAPNGQRLQVHKAVCLEHVRTREYPLLPNDEQHS